MLKQGRISGPVRRTSTVGETFFGPDSCLVTTGGTGNKERAILNFNTWLKNRKPQDIIVYTDGSQETKEGSVSMGAGAGVEEQRLKRITTHLTRSPYFLALSLAYFPSSYNLAVW